MCVARQKAWPANRRVPGHVVLAKHAAMVDAWPGLPGEGFDHVVADNLYRLEALLKPLSDARRAELGWDGSEGLGDLLLVRRYFGPEILPLWRWRDGSQLAGGDRIAEIRLRADRIVLAQHNDVDGAGDVGFDVMVGCPADDECEGQAWAPVYNVTDLLRALTGELMHDPDVRCTLHGPHGNDDQDEDLKGRADLDAEFTEAVRG
ncbi:hypothetical protein [Streptomyces sp. NPDC023588]|uniref:hypothetical protein n=1 Tax=Streptomyces sp. NPDC023588 TaxID=3154907 RepID=UPI0033C768DD